MQDLYGWETNPNFTGTTPGEPFDAALEEVLHFITNGYAAIFPKAFGAAKPGDSKLTAAMDKARGGAFTTIPKPYPANAWYTYDDATCTYSCMAVEYFYWVHTTILGAQQQRLDTIGREWRPNTLEKLK